VKEGHLARVEEAPGEDEAVPRVSSELGGGQGSTGHGGAGLRRGWYTRRRGFPVYDSVIGPRGPFPHN